MKKFKVHLRILPGMNRPPCGKTAKGTQFLTSDKTQVTCALCLAAISFEVK